MPNELGAACTTVAVAKPPPTAADGIKQAMTAYLEIQFILTLPITDEFADRIIHAGGSNLGGIRALVVPMWWVKSRDCCGLALDSFNNGELVLK